MKNVWIEDSLHEEIKVISARRKVSITEILNEIIKEYFLENGISVENTPLDID